jgi:DNA-directed RNA polymerase subunit M/transcription elongation factor TFIIS
MNCPHCQRLLYSRQHRHCGFCGKELPKEFRLSEEEVVALKTEQDQIALRRAAAKAKEEAEREQQKRNADGGYSMPPMG